MTPTYTLADVRDLAVLPVWSESGPSAAAVLGMSRTVAYRAATAGDLPTLRLAGRIVVAVPALLRMLGADPAAPGDIGRDIGGDDEAPEVAAERDTPPPIRAVT